MEVAGIRSGRRGRKRRREDVQSGLNDREAKKEVVVETRSKALVGRYVKKEFKGSGNFIGKIVGYKTGLYRVEYEGGGCEDSETNEVRRFLVGDGDFDGGLMLRMKKLNELVEKKNVEGNVKAAYSLNELCNNGANEIDAVRIDDVANLSSDSCEHGGDLSPEDAAPFVPPPQLPPSSGNIGVPEEYVSHLFSVYGFLRSFSIRLFLSPFGLDDFVGSLNCTIPNTLLDAIHVALMRVLRRHLEMLSSDGSELASKCLRFTNWSLLDTLTWPVYLVQYLMVMGYTNDSKWKGFYIDVLEKDYYTLSAGRKLMILQILCDDVLESEELSAEIDMRIESEIGIDSDVVAAVDSESGPRRVHPRYSKTSACKNEEAVDIRAETYVTNSSCSSSYFGVKGTEMHVDADITQDGNGDECRLCGMDGTLLCCDGCPSVYHSRCIGVSKMSIPDGAWYCPECTINKLDPAIGRGTSLRGADIFGIDSYGQVFLGTCNHLLVLKVSIKSEPCLRYYNQNDIPKVLQALHSFVQHVVLYSEICKGILQYWDMQKDILPLLEAVKMCKQSVNVKEDGECSIPSLGLLGEESHKLLDLVKGENLATCETESSVVVSCMENSCKEPGFNKSSMETMTQNECPSQRSGDTTAKQVFHLKNTEFSEQTQLDHTVSSGPVIQQADSSVLTHQSFSEKSSLMEFATCTLGNSNGKYKGHVNGICVTVNMTTQSKEGNEQVAGCYRNSSDHCVYMGSHFKSQTYINNYFQGDFAASAAANLAILLSDENRVSKSSDNRRKLVSADNSLQVKAFSSAAVHFFWLNEKKLVEVPRERCGWCLSCKAPVTSKKACLLNAAASNAIKGAMKILAGLRPIKNGEGSIPGIAIYVMSMEESLWGLTVGPFRSATYRKQWRKHVEQATTCGAVKALLLELETNIRAVALSGDWVKLVDNWSVESPETQSATATFATGSTQKRGTSGKRGRKQSSMSEITSIDCLDKLSDFSWWRGGLLSKLILQRGILARSMVKKAARKGGCRKIPGIYYAEGCEIPKRSRQYYWRAAVELSKNASQLALQVRYLDLHVRWNDLVRPEQNLQDGKGPETEASAFRNAFVCDKKNMGDKIIYGVAFGNQKHLPSRVMKNVIDVEQSQDGSEKYWFSEMRIPLYLVKEYEENLSKMDLPLADKPVNALSNLQIRQLKASRKDIFSYLSCKRDNLDKCCCASCQLDVLLGIAVKCSACQGFCHEQCTISSTIQRNGKIEFLITCKQCCHPQTLPQSENCNESPTSPLLLQGQEFQNAVTVSKGAKKKSFRQPFSSVGHIESSLEMKSATHNSNSVLKSQRKLCSWGLIWKKNKKDEDTKDNGFDFRLKNILLRGNSNPIWPKIECHLCHKPYNSALMYIRCELCTNWYHAEAVELEESKIFEVVGFKCCRCRRIRSPVCPYLDPESKKKLEAKRPHIRRLKAGNSKLGIDNGNTSEDFEQPKVLGSTSPMLPANEEVLSAQEEKHCYRSLSIVEQVKENILGMDFDLIASTASGSGPPKPSVRRHMKNEKSGPSANNLSHIELSAPTEPNNLMNPKGKLLSPCVEGDVYKNGFEHGMSIDLEGVNYQDMEFEPQTYFSFTELLASDDDGELDEVVASGNVMGDRKNSFAVPRDGFPVQCGMGTNKQQESTIPVKTAIELVHCRTCSGTEPRPDLSCHICGLWIHSHCSPWDEEQTSWEGSWRCANCREWR